MSVLTELQDIKKELHRQNLAHKRVMNVEEVEEYFGIPRKQIYKLTSQKRIPHSKKNGLWFLREAVEDWLLSNPITTEADLEKQAASYILRNRKAS